MLNKVKVLIAIQARSNSKRFPEKIFQIVGNKRVIDHVIEKAVSAQRYVERSTNKAIIECEVAVLFPKDDKKIKENLISNKVKFLMIESESENEDDVLSRYLTAYEKLSPDYIVRITSDCPLLQDYVISKHINVAVHNNLDYVSNVWEKARLMFDGLDVEVMSRRAIEWLTTNAVTDQHKEHVTLAIREEFPQHLTYGFVQSKLDTSSLKLSLDTEEDLSNIRKYYHEREIKTEYAKRMFGNRGVFEI